MFGKPEKWQKGYKISNRFEIHRVLKGGMGVVYVCYDYKHKTFLALKTLQDKFLKSEQSKKLFEREALVWTELEKHPFIVRAMWVEKLEYKIFIVLEYIAPDKQGRNTLTHYLGHLSYPDILKYSIQFCYGMEHAYKKGIDAHRDIKPDNIMITSNKTVKITDFGLVKAFQEIVSKEEITSEEEKSGLSIFKSMDKNVCGTLNYMPPEQFEGEADKRSDIYSFGITLYQMVSGGDLPFVGSSKDEYKRLHKEEKTPFLSSPLFPIIRKCLEKNPDKRFQGFTPIRKGLEKMLLKETGEKISPPTEAEFEAWELLNKGVALGSLRRYNEAIDCYDKAIRINPEFAYAWHNKGTALDNLGNYNEAITCYDKVIGINPEDAYAWINKGTALYNLGRYKEAIKCYDGAIRINPEDATVWNNKGVTLNNLGRYNEAIDCYDKAIRINPEFAEAWNNKGAALHNLGNNDEEIKCCDMAVRINPEYAEAWYNKGNAFYNLGRFNEALKCTEQVIKINPNIPQAHQLKQKILQQLGR